MADLVRHRALSLSLASIGVMLSAGSGFAQSVIVPDGILGANASQVCFSCPGLPGGRPGERIDGGALRGNNLFHSFERFNVSPGRSAYFQVSPTTSNIISRVTGSEASFIFGTLGVFGGDANLFFLNPSGIFFGPGSALDIRGSFAASTASSIQFGEQGSFSAVEPQEPALLTVNPTAFLFNQMNPRPIAVERGVLEVPTGRSLALVGGEITLKEKSL